ncbi:unnamed protein product [Merluccius merluccius]
MEARIDDDGKRNQENESEFIYALLPLLHLVGHTKTCEYSPAGPVAGSVFSRSGVQAQGEPLYWRGEHNMNGRTMRWSSEPQPRYRLATASPPPQG